MEDSEILNASVEDLIVGLTEEEQEIVGKFFFWVLPKMRNIRQRRLDSLKETTDVTPDNN